MAFNREFLKKAFPEITKEQLDALMNEHGTELTSLNEKITAMTTERDGLKTQLTQRDVDFAELKKKAEGSDTLKTQLDEMQTKYKTDTEQLQASLTKQQVDFAVDKMFTGIKFTSDLAKEAAVAKFKSQNLKLKDGAFEGGDTFIADIKAKNPSAFVPEDGDQGGSGGQGGNQDPPPRFTGGTGGNGGGGGGNQNPFSFGFQEVRTTK